MPSGSWTPWSFLVAGALVATAPSTQQQSGTVPPLPSHSRLLLPWGQRVAWERDSRHLLFMEKAFGDAYRIDIATGQLEPLTAHYPHAGYDRIQQISNGDYLLTGPDQYDPKNPWRDRHRLRMFVLDRGLDRPAVRLDDEIDEGPAVSALVPRIAWTAPGQRDMYMADVVYASGVPSLANKRLVLSYASEPQTMRLETQDFRPPDERELIFSCYSGTVEEPFFFSDVCGVDLATGKVVNYSNTPEQYDEPEGVYPDGKYTLVESDRHTVNKQWRHDLYRLALDGSNRADRLTFLEGPTNKYRGSNGVVSPNGKYMAYQLGTVGPQAGQGRGIVLMDFARWAP